MDCTDGDSYAAGDIGGEQAGNSDKVYSWQRSWQKQSEDIR